MLKSLDVPLLRKELIELANRRRTYVIRTFYAALFFGLVVVSAKNSGFMMTNDPYSVLGYGRIIFDQIFLWQAIGVYLFMPAIASTTITREREAGTLEILMTTKLSPATIIRDKILSQVVPMWTLILIATPLTTLAYSMGGLSEYKVLSTAVLLMAETLRVASFGVACSSVSQSNVKAVALSYVWSTIGAFAIGLGQINTIMLVTTLAGIAFACFVAMAIATSSLVTLQQRPAGEARADIFYDRKGFKPKDRLEALLKNFIVRDRDLPSDNPIEWRERSLRCQTRGNFMLRISVWIFSLMFILIFTGGGLRFSGGTFALIIMISFLMIPVVIVKATSIIATERNRETLNVLLTMPIDGASLIRQKLYEVPNSIWLFSALIGICVAFEGYWRYQIQTGTVPEFMVLSLFAFFVYPRLAMWTSLWLGTLLRNATAAMLIAIGICAVIVFLPLNVDLGPELRDVMMSISPITFWCHTIAKPLFATTFAYIHVAIFTITWLVLSQLYVRRVDRLLGRL